MERGLAKTKVAAGGSCPPSWEQQHPVKALDLKNAIHIGHSTGGGELTRYGGGP